MSKFDTNKYISEYKKGHYTRSKVEIKNDDVPEIEEYRQIQGLSKNALFIKCVQYCARNNIDLKSEMPIKPKK